jgi:hypothetical protein
VFGGPPVPTLLVEDALAWALLRPWLAAVGAVLLLVCTEVMDGLLASLLRLTTGHASVATTARTPEIRGGPGPLPTAPTAEPATTSITLPNRRATGRR